MRISLFTLDALDGEVLEGYDTGQRWNGWAVPVFSFVQAQAVLEAWRRSGRRADYDDHADAFQFEMEQDSADGTPAEEEVVAPVEHEGDRYYPIGSGAWIWEEVPVRDETADEV